MQKYDQHVSYIPGKSMHAADALFPAKMMIGRKLRNNLPELIKNSNISVSLKERDRQRAKQKFYFNRQGTRELELSKLGDPNQI